MPNILSNKLNQLKTNWLKLGKRERLLISVAIIAISILIIWTLFLKPVINTIKQAPAQRATLNAQMQNMQQMKQLAEKLKSEPKIKAAQANEALRQITQNLLGDAAILTITGQTAQLSIKNIPAASFSKWLEDARVSARTKIIQSKLTTNPSDKSISGTLSLTLPADN